MQQDAEHYICTCERCIRFKAKPQKEELHLILATYPLEFVHMDYHTIESPKGDQDINILVITDHFTHFAQAIVTTLQTAKVMAQTLWNQFIMRYGLPSSITSDQGQIFESKLIHQLLWTNTH